MNERSKYRDYRTEPKYTGTTVEDHLIFLRDTFSDVVPTQIIHSNEKDNRYKVRKNWWQGLIADLETILERGTLNQEVTEEVGSFIDGVISDEFRLRPTSEDDISQANNLISQLVAETEEDPMLWTEDRPYKINWTQ